MQIVIQHARGLRVAPPLGKSDYFRDTYAAIEPDRQHVAGLHGMSRSGFAHAIDADMAGFDQGGSAGARPHHPRMP